jgi:hypothetical protein
MSEKDPTIVDWEKVGGYMRRALVEVSQELGGQDVALQAIQNAGDVDDILPDTKALAFLDANFPGAAESVLVRAEQIQRAQLPKRGNVLARLFRR